MSAKSKLCIGGLSFVLAIDFYLSAAEMEFSPRLAGRGQGEGCEPSGEAPRWTIPYGREFWRRGKKPDAASPGTPNTSSAMISANIDLGDVIARVSHAIIRDVSSSVHRVQAKTYSAAFDESGLHFSPHQPRKGELPSATGAVDNGERERPGRSSRRPADWSPHTNALLDGYLPWQPDVFGRRSKTAGATPVLPNLAPSLRWTANRGIAPAGDHQSNRLFPLPDPETEVTLRTRSVRSGEQVLYKRDAQPLRWSLLGNTAQALLNERFGLVEHYEAGGEGIHVSWVLNPPPAGEDPLEIEFEMEALSYAGTSDHGIHLADATATARVCIGKAFAVDSAGRRSELAIVVHEGRFYVRVSREILAQANYPLAIDPVISPEFGMDQPVIVPRYGRHYAPAVASNGTNCLVVWAERFPEFEGDTVIFGARVSRDGSVLDPLGITISKPNFLPATPAVASNGKDYLVVWDYFDMNTGGDIHGARVTADGQVADKDEIVISNAGDQFYPSVAGGSDGYFVVWQVHITVSSDLDVYGTRVSNEGVVLDGDGLPISRAPGHQGSPSVARGPDGYLVVWHDSLEFQPGTADIFGARVDRNGTVLDTNAIAICIAPKHQFYPFVAGNSTGYLVVWEDRRNSTENTEEKDIYGTLVSSAGEVLNPQGIAISTASGNQTNPSATAGANDFLVFWSDSQASQPGTYGSRVSATGMVSNPDGVLVLSGAYASRAAASGDGFLVVWSGPGQVGGSAILAARLNSRAEVMDPEPILMSRKANDQNSPAVAFNGTNWLVVWQDFRSFASARDIYGVRIGPDGTALDTAAIPICTQPGYQFNPAVASAGADYLVVWTDDRNFATNFDDIYGARVRGDGTVMDPGGIAICAAPGFQYNSAVTSDGTNYLVVWQSGNIYAARVNKDGVVLEPNGFPVSAGAVGHYTPDAAFNGTEFLVVWGQGLERDSDIGGARVGPDGGVLDPTGISISRAPYAQTTPAVASAGSDFLVIWADTRNTVASGGNTYGGHIYGARVNSDGRVLDPDGFLISTAAFLAFPAVAFNGTDFLAVWGSAGVSAGPTRLIWAAWIARDGQLLLRELTVNTTGIDTNEIFPAVVAGPSNSFLVLAEGSRNGATRVIGNVVSLADTPVLQSVTFGGGVANISWRAEAGKTYRVQFKPDLGYTNWNDLEPLVTATNFAASILDPTIGRDAQRFYRVLQLP